MSDFFDLYEYVRVPQSDGTEAFLCLGCGGYGAVFEVRRRPPPPPPAAGSDGASGVGVAVAGDAAAAAAAALCVKISKACGPVPPSRQAAFARELEKMRSLGDCAAAGVPLAALEAGFAEAAAAGSGGGGGGGALRLVMARSPRARAWPVPAAAGEAEPDLRAHAALFAGTRGSGCDLVDSADFPLPLSLAAARAVMRQLFRALEFLHEHALLHRDVKPENVLVWGETLSAAGERLPVVRLTDLGLARALDPADALYTANVGTRRYAAPETAAAPSAAGAVYGPGVDVFSAGCTLYALLLADLPSDDVRTVFPERFHMGDGVAAQATPPEKRAKIQAAISGDAMNFLARTTCLEEWRMTAKQALAHPFLAGEE